MGDEADFIGRGIRFPLGVDQTGALAMTTGPDDIDRSIRLVLATAKGERLMRPEFGCAIWDQLFEPVNANTLGLMAQAVRDAVSQWEPRAELKRVEVAPDDDNPSLVNIGVWYKVRTSNDRRNLVHPFYVIPREDTP
jgi:uncharacterized protein